MNRGTGFARGKEAIARRKAKEARRKLLGNKEQGQSVVRKGPARDDAHLARVRKRKCLICKDGLRVRQTTPTHAHHCRSLNGAMLGKRPSDYLVVPLCAEHHLDQFPAGLHKIGEATFWKIAQAAYGIDPVQWIAQFSRAGADEIMCLGLMTIEQIAFFKSRHETLDKSQAV